MAGGRWMANTSTMAAFGWVAGMAWHGMTWHHDGHCSNTSHQYKLNSRDSCDTWYCHLTTLFCITFCFTKFPQWWGQHQCVFTFITSHHSQPKNRLLSVLSFSIQRDKRGSISLWGCWLVLLSKCGDEWVWCAIQRIMRWSWPPRLAHHYNALGEAPARRCVHTPHTTATLQAISSWWIKMFYSNGYTTIEGTFEDIVILTWL